MKGVVALIGVGVIILLMGAIMAALTGFRSVEITAPYNVTTDGSTQQGAVVLANDVLDDNKINIEVSSSDQDDAPVPFTYVPSTNTLTVTGLAVSTTRTLTVIYKVSSLDGVLDVLARYFPLFLILGALGIVAGIIAGAVQSARGG